MNTVNLSPATTQTLLRRIDLMMQELQEIRRLVAVQQTAPTQPELVAQLAGALAPAHPGALSAAEEYAAFSDWERFADA